MRHNVVFNRHVGKLSFRDTAETLWFGCSGVSRRKADGLF